MDKSILLNGNATKVLFDIDENHSVVKGLYSKIVLTKDQILKGTQINLVLPREKEILLNHYLIKRAKRILDKKGKSDLYVVFDLHWGIESYENISIALGYNKNDEIELITWLRNFAVSFPDNSGWIECYNHLLNAKFHPKFKSINVDLAYYHKKYKVQVQCCDGFSVEFYEKLIDIFPFF